MDTSSDAPYLDCAYKLQEYADKPRRKRSEGKATWPGSKQVYRRYDRQGRMSRDTLALDDDRHDGRALLQQVMKKGKRLIRIPLEVSRRYVQEELASLPPALRSLEQAAPYPVEVAPSLRALAATLDARNS
jgi:nicotinate phosphoribosyltransferase